eukprot:38042-Chlamydomonas_euryale.AAC.1
MPHPRRRCCWARCRRPSETAAASCGVRCWRRCYRACSLAAVAARAPPRWGGCVRPTAPPCLAP